MLSELTRLKDEATRLLTVYEMYKDSEYDYMRRKAHMDIDRFLMENRETALILTIQGLQDAFDQEVAKQKSAHKTSDTAPWYKKLFGGNKNAKSNDKVNSETINNV